MYLARGTRGSWISTANRFLYRSALEGFVSVCLNHKPACISASQLNCKHLRIKIKKQKHLLWKHFGFRYQGTTTALLRAPGRWQEKKHPQFCKAVPFTNKLENKVVHETIQPGLVPVGADPAFCNLFFPKHSPPPWASRRERQTWRLRDISLFLQRPEARRAGAGLVHLLAAGQDGLLDEREHDEDAGALAPLPFCEVVGHHVISWLHCGGQHILPG